MSVSVSASTASKFFSQKVMTMNQSERRAWLIQYLLDERGQQMELPSSEEDQRLVLRALVNVREANPINDKFRAVEQSYLQSRLAQLDVTDAANLPTDDDGITLWRGDITTLKCDAIVNAANSGMTGCWAPNHHCIDNAIHTFAGVDLRLTCAQLMDAQGYPEPTGTAKITPAYNLPCQYVLHTVGPIVDSVDGQPTAEQREQLASCYRSCLELAAAHKLTSVAFCSISTGVFRFPIDQAAAIAVETVREYSRTTNSSVKQVIFDVFSERDFHVYASLLA